MKFKKLYKMMKKAGVSQLKLCWLIDVTPLTLARKLKGGTDFKLGEALKITKYFNELLNEKNTVEEIFEEEKNNEQ